jgi:hypothetical protein
MVSFVAGMLPEDKFTRRMNDKTLIMYRRPALMMSILDTGVG